MSKTITVDVTQDDIDQGKCSNVRDCAVARATARALDMNEGVMFGSTIAYLGVLTPTEPVRLPEEVKTFITAFDSREAVKPFSFSLEIPDS
jgi:hypothetical protein